MKSDADWFYQLKETLVVHGCFSLQCECAKLEVKYYTYPIKYVFSSQLFIFTFQKNIILKFA